jgi:hypothetical protein
LEKYPDKPWDWYWISGNPNITPEYIERHPDKPWVWFYISQNPNITPEFIEFIETQSDKPWDKLWSWEYISCNTFKPKNVI